MHMPNYRISLVKEGEITYEVTGPDIAIQAAKAVLPPDLDREQFWILLLDTSHHVVGTNCVSIGTINANWVYPREVFKAAILANCESIILAHNHPAGSLKPSSEDIALTRRLVDAGRILGIAVLDHIIIGDGAFSFQDTGMMPISRVPI
jgi:DNA repair protein RadC